jgi:hypothetical protein
MIPVHVRNMFPLVAAAIAVARGCGAAAPAAKVALTVDARQAAITHRLRPLDMGCHSDTGYSHQPMGLHAQRIYGPSFEAPAPVHATTDGTGWVDASSGGGVGGATLDAKTAFHGFSSEKLSFRGGGGRAAVANRGLGNEGLFFEAGKDYEGYFWTKALQPAKLTVAIEAWSPRPGEPPRVLASTTVAVAAGDGWAMHSFSLTPSAGTECIGIEAGGALARANNITCPVNGTYNPQGDVSDRSAHVCVRCGGQFVLSLEGPAGEVNLDYVYMSPGEWGRFAGLPVLAEGVKWLQGMGTSLFRMGGSFCSGNNYFWKRWRGLPWTRPSAAAAWGHDFEGGWGPFEMVDMANAMGVEAVITTFAVGDVQVPSADGARATTRPITPDDMADLVEYSFGDASTKWGRMRIEQDQHPAIYNWSYIELGNEQCECTSQKKASALQLHYM